MTVFFNPQNKHSLEQIIDNPKIPAHEKIGSLFSEILSLLKNPVHDRSQLAIFLERLGVSPEDPEAIESSSQLLLKLEDGTLKICPTANTGIYFIKKTDSNLKDREIAVFKIGRKRACIETMVRSFANGLGLNKHMLPGLFCAIQNPPLFGNKLNNEEETVEELWNGSDKIYLSQQASSKLKKSEISFSIASSFEFDDTKSNVEKTACAVVGIIQPFLQDQQEACLYDFTLMTVLALAIGLRDGKKDGYKSSTLLDVEDCMPVRIDPTWTKEKIEKSVSALDLPYLDQDPRSSTKLSLEEVCKLAELVQKWKITALVKHLSQFKIRYEDRQAEVMKKKTRGYDEGECYITVVNGEPHLINGKLNHLASNPDMHLLLEEQLEACNTRLQRIRDFIIDCAMNQKSFTPQELVFAVDRYGQILHDAIRHSPKLPRGIDQILDGQGINHLLGRHSPDQMKIVVPIPSLAKATTLPPTAQSTIIENLEQSAKTFSDKKKSNDK